MACQRIAIAAASAFEHQFLFVFCLLERKLILGDKTQEKSISSITCKVVSYIFIFEMLF